MYLILKTYANCDLEGVALTECAVIQVSKESIDYWLAMMEEASKLSAKLDKAITLSWMDYTPDCYEWIPETVSYEDLDPGYTVLDVLPLMDAAQNDGEPQEPESLSYCELRVSATEIGWWYGPKRGNAEEYTATLTRQDLESIAVDLAPEVPA